MLHIIWFTRLLEPLVPVIISFLIDIIILISSYCMLHIVSYMLYMYICYISLSLYIYIYIYISASLFIHMCYLIFQNLILQSTLET